MFWGDLGGLGECLVAAGVKSLEKRSKKGQKEDLFGPFWDAFGGFGPPSGRPGGHLGCILGVLGSIWELLGRFLEHFWSILVDGLNIKKPIKTLDF